MWADWQTHWALFGDSHLSAWLIAGGLSLLGILLLGRRQVFLAAATAQSAMLALALCFWLAFTFGWAWLAGTTATTLATVLAATLAGLLGGQRQPLLNEAHSGVLFIGASSGSMLLRAHSPHGLAEVQQLLTSSLIGASRNDVWLHLGWVSTLLALWLRQQNSWLLATFDPACAQAQGLPVRRWHWQTVLLSGIGIALALRTTGMLYVFACLLLPALIARPWSHSLRQLSLLTPVCAMAASVSGSALAHWLDLPPAQLCSAWLVLWYLASSALRRFRPDAQFGKENTTFTRESTWLRSR